VFGQKMSVQRKLDEWLLFTDPNSGLRARVYDVVIPPDLTEDELVSYLDDIYHEWANETFATVKRL
jgi:hypothetical protein